MSDSDQIVVAVTKHDQGKRRGTIDVFMPRLGGLALAGRSRSLCRYTRATSGPKVLANEQELWVSYVSPSMLRRQLSGLAQQVRSLAVDEPSPETVLPEIVLPDGPKLRHGYFFLRFRERGHRDAAIKTLDGQPFATACGTLSGSLQLDAGRGAFDVRAMLNLPQSEPDPVDEWLRRRFGVYGNITSLQLPRVRNNWDAGLAFIRFADPDEADAALEALDGTPSPIAGCNMFIDYSVAKPELASAAT